MKTSLFSRLVLTLLLAGLIVVACGPGTATAPPPSPTAPPSTATSATRGRCGDGVCDGPENAQNCPQDCAQATPPPPTEPSVAQGRCGDGKCEGPENAQNCPQDCATTVVPPADTPIPPAAVPGGQQGDASPCLNPNPHRAVISKELLDWYNWLDDGGFEEGRTDVVLSDLGTFSRAMAERVAGAARTGSWGYAITAGPGEGVTFSIRTNMEKGETTRFSFWARSPTGQVSLRPTVYGVKSYAEVAPTIEIHTSDSPLTIGPDWTQVSFTADNTTGLVYALLSLEVGPNTTLHIDDAQVEFPTWRMAEYPGESRMLGGIPVPPEPVAPVHISFLIHIEDPPQIQVVEEYFQQKTAVFRELARVFHKHGGFLTIQPEEDWVMGASVFAPDVLKELVKDYNVVYSTHTHGPHCRDDQGRLRSLTDCNMDRDTKGWDQSITAYEYPWVVEYVRNLRDFIASASGTPVTDHNGNWEFDQASRFAEIPMLTWSAYKNRHTQRTYDVLINNPWRPTECGADAEINRFLTHDPDTQIIYIPGWGQAITRHPERVLTRMRPMVSQFIRFADPDRINTFYVVFHVDHFYSREENPDYIAYDEKTGELTYSAEFERHIQYWDDMLTELIDPLVAEGYLQWTSLPEMGELYLEWEKNCGLR